MEGQDKKGRVGIFLGDIHSIENFRMEEVEFLDLPSFEFPNYYKNSNRDAERGGIYLPFFLRTLFLKRTPFPDRFLVARGREEKQGSMDLNIWGLAPMKVEREIKGGGEWEEVKKKVVAL